MGKVERFEGVKASDLPDHIRKELGLGPGDLVDLQVEPKVRGGERDMDEFDRIVARLQEAAAGSGVTSENCTDFLYDEDGLPA